MSFEKIIGKVFTPDEYVENMVEIEFTDKDIDRGFNFTNETLKRIGVTSRDKNVLYPSCVLLHKRGRYYVAHFKEMFVLDGQSNHLTAGDLCRRNKICEILESWNLIEIKNKSVMEGEFASMGSIKVLKHSELSDWEVVHKYVVGNG